MKILAIKLRAIGDTVLWTSALAGLKKALPQAEIHGLTFANNGAVLQNHPALNHLHLLSGHSNWHLWRQLLRLRGENFDWLLGFHATTSLCRWASWAGAKQMALHHHSWTYTPKGSVLLSSPGRLQSTQARDYQLLRPLGISPSHFMPTKIHLLESEQEKAKAKVDEVIGHGSGRLKGPRVAYLPGGSYALKRYPLDLWWPKLLNDRKSQGVQPLVIVNPELSRNWDLPRLCQNEKVPLLDHGSLREIIGWIAQCQFAVANDSAPGHMAAALGVRTTFLFGPGCVGDFYSYDPKVHPLVRIAVPCRDSGPRQPESFQFCTRQECEHQRCMRELPNFPAVPN